MREKIRFGQIDLFKFIAALLVIMIHTDPLESYSSEANFVLTRLVARLAVPFFFVSAGYLFAIKLTDDPVKNNGILAKYVKRISYVYSIAMICYIPINIYSGYFKGSKQLINFAQDIVFNGTMYHLWYLPALMIGIVIVYYMKTKWGYSVSLLMCIFLYSIGLLGDSYYGFISELNIFKRIYDLFFSMFEYTRNGIFFAPIFLLLGFKLSSYYNKDKRKVEVRKDIIAFLMCFMLLSVELWALNKYNIPKHDSMAIFLVPTTFFLLKVCLQLSSKPMRNLREMSLFIYILHPMVIVIVRLIGKITKMTDILVNNSMAHYLVVTLGSIAIAANLIYFKQRHQIIKLKNEKVNS
ncbi:MAG: acyltransferase family protein [Cellulosilyticaceae bacterium]